MARLLIRFRTSHTPGHVHVHVYVVHNDNVATLAGDLVFTPEQWALLRSAARWRASAAISTEPATDILIEGDQ